MRYTRDRDLSSGLVAGGQSTEERDYTIPWQTSPTYKDARAFKVSLKKVWS